MKGAVITADIVNSTGLNKAIEKKLRYQLKKILAGHTHEFYRGDSLQIFLKDPRLALQIVLLLRAAAQKMGSQSVRFDIKASIGIGNVKTPVTDIRTAKGEAFIISGRAFDKEILGLHKKLVIHCGEEPFDTAFELVSEYTDDIASRLTPKQAAVVFELLSGHNQEAIAKKLQKSQPTISKQVNAAGWNQLQRLLIKFERLIKLLSS